MNTNSSRFAKYLELWFDKNDGMLRGGEHSWQSWAQSTILKVKSNFTLWTTEYIFTVFDFNQIKYCNELLVPALT